MFEAPRPAIGPPSLARQKQVLWLSFVVIIAVSLLAFVSIQRLIASSVRVQQSQAVLIEIDRFLSDLKDVETGGRGYALSGGDERHLQRQMQGIAAVARTEARLRALPTGPRLKAELDRLYALTSERIESSQVMVAQRHDLQATRRNLLAGMRTMDRIRDEVAVILSNQQRQYREESRRLEQQAWITSIALVLGVVLCLGVIAWLFSLRGREVERRRQLEEELRALNLELEDRVQRRTADVKRASDFLNAVVENLPDMVLLKEPSGDGFRYLLVNAAGERLLGRDRSDIVGRTERQLFPAEEAAQVVEANKAVADSGRPRTFTDRKLTTPSGVRTVETRMVPIADDHGRTALVLAIVRDVTSAKAIEERLRESEERATKIVEAALDAVITIDRHGVITGWNPQAEKTFGWTQEEALGRPIEETIMPERYRQAHLAGLERYIATGEAKVLNRRLELVALHRNGKEFPVELAITPLRLGGKITFSAFLRDITGDKAREEQIRHLQRMDAIGRLTGGVAHDFNNLLAIIHGNSELLRSELDEGSESVEMADDVIGAAGRGAELVKRLLAFARMQHLEPEPIDLNARLPNILGLLQRALGENVDVQLKPAKRLWRAIVDQTQVDDALVNLAINARDAMPDGGTVTIETRNITLDDDYAANHIEVSPGDYVMLAVSDTGEGMPPDVVERAFEPFFTTKEEGKGTGLGLSQVFGWVKQSGGHIKIYSEVGHGTTIKLYLPRATGKSAVKEDEPEIATPKGDETILVVEDNPNVRKTVIRQLHDLGYRTVEAESGAEALRLVHGGLQFDLLLTDIVMPGGMTGYQLADVLRADRQNLKILFTSGYTDLAIATGQPDRKDPLLSKPYCKQDLGRAIRAVLDEVRTVAAD